LDNRCLAIVSMNLAMVLTTVQGVLFKKVALEGVSILEYTLFRNVTIALFACAQLIHKDINPFKGFPKAQVKDLVMRSVAG
jgi:Mlc titration factor MtfA (ptsG expression regulator)